MNRLTAGRPNRHSREDRLTVIKVQLLLAATLAYNVLEGALAIWAGVQAGSLALTAFGADSYLEVAAAGVVLWRLRASGDREQSEAAEERAYQFIGWTFLALAGLVIYQVADALLASRGAEESLLGIGLALASITVMPALAIWKLRLAAEANLGLVAAEAKETLACCYLSLTLLLGLVANALLGWWWLDALTALLLTPWLIREGLEGIRGDHCGEDARLCSCRACWFGLRSCPLPCCAA